MATKLFDLYLEQISYEGGNIGSNLTVTLKPGGYPVTSFKPQVCEAGMQKPLAFGKSTNGTSRLLVRDLSSAGAVTIPMAVTVEEKDVVSDQGANTKNLVIDLNGPSVQPFDMVVAVAGKGGNKDKGKTAKFVFRFAAALDGGPRLFRLGADNIGFENPQGAVKLSGMNGNCYTMAVVAKLFHQAAEFKAAVGPGEIKGFDPKDVARALRARDFPATKFPVRGYESLFAMSDARALSDPEDWMDKTSRFTTGLSPVGPKQPGPVNADALVALYRMITTIHYLHYFQNQAAPLIRSAVDRLQGGQDAVKRIAADTIAALKRGLANGDLGLLCMLNPDLEVLFGHVVLAYKVVDDPSAPHVDIYVYDNNKVYTAGTDETVLRVERATGRFDYMDKPKCQDAAFRNPKRDPDPKKDRKPDSSFTWWDRNGQVLVLLPDSNADPANRAELAAKLENGVEATAYIQATGDLIHDVTQNAPSKNEQTPKAQGISTLFDDVKKFILACQRTNKKLGTTPRWRKYDLPDNATVEVMNLYLAVYTELTIKELLPFVLPKGLALSDTKIQFDGANRNTASVQTTLTITPETPIEQVVKAVQDSAVFALDPRLKTTVQNFGTVFEKAKLELDVALALTKTHTPAALEPKIGPYAPVPSLEGSHCVISVAKEKPDAPIVFFTDVTPRKGEHRISIGEKVLEAALLSVLDTAGAFNKYTFNYTVLLPKQGNFTLKSAAVFCEQDSLRQGLVNRREQDSLAVATQATAFLEGADISTDVTFRLFVAKKRGKKNLFSVAGRVAGRLRVGDGVAAAKVAVAVAAFEPFLRVVFPSVAKAVNDVVNAQIEPFVTFANGTNFSLGLPTIKSDKEDIRRATLNLPVNPFDVDLGATIKKLFGKDVPFEIKEIKSNKGWLVITLE